MFPYEILRAATFTVAFKQPPAKPSKMADSSLRSTSLRRGSNSSFRRIVSNNRPDHDTQDELSRKSEGKLKVPRRTVREAEQLWSTRGRKPTREQLKQMHRENSILSSAPKNMDKPQMSPSRMFYRGALSQRRQRSTKMSANAMDPPSLKDLIIESDDIELTSTVEVKLARVEKHRSGDNPSTLPKRRKQLQFQSRCFPFQAKARSQVSAGTKLFNREPSRSKSRERIQRSFSNRLRHENEISPYCESREIDLVITPKRPSWRDSADDYSAASLGTKSTDSSQSKTLTSAFSSLKIRRRAGFGRKSSPFLNDNTITSSDAQFLDVSPRGYTPSEHQSYPAHEENGDDTQTANEKKRSSFHFCANDHIDQKVRGEKKPEETIEPTTVYSPKDLGAPPPPIKAITNRQTSLFHIFNDAFVELTSLCAEYSKPNEQQQNEQRSISMVELKRSSPHI